MTVEETVIEDEFGIDEDAVDPEDDDGDYELDPDLAKLKGIDLEWEDRPVQSREPRVKIVIPWETKFQFLKEGDAVGKSLRIFSFPPEEFKKPESRSKGKAKEIRSRLFATVPHEDWSVSARPWNDGSWRVYIMFNKFLTDDETKARLERYEERKRILEIAQAKSPLVQRGREMAAEREAEARKEEAEAATSVESE